MKPLYEEFEDYMFDDDLYDDDDTKSFVKVFMRLYGYGYQEIKDIGKRNLYDIFKMTS